MKILKVINNNNVCVLDKRGKELIVSGKGLGFGKKPGDEINSEDIQKTYLITDSEMQKRLVELLQDIPEGYIKFTDSLISHIRETLGGDISESLLITLSDHLCFAIKRKRKGIELTNPMMDTLRLCYPQELKMGYYCLEQMEKRLNVSFISDEAGFIAMHIINARQNTEMSSTYMLTKLISGCMEFTLARFPNIDRSSDSCERYMMHLKYLAQRCIDKKSLPALLTGNAEFSDYMSKAYPYEYKCAEEMREYIIQTTGFDITEEEIITLTIHMAKMNS